MKKIIYIINILKYNINKIIIRMIYKITETKLQKKFYKTKLIKKFQNKNFKTKILKNNKTNKNNL